MKTIILCAVALLLTAGACQKKIPKLTTTGANKVYCLINGQRYESMTDLFAPGVNEYINTLNPAFPKSLNITGNLYKINVNDMDYKIHINIDHFEGVGNYSLKESGNHVTLVKFKQHGNEYRTSSYGNIGIIEVVYYDEANGVASGRFNFEIIKNEKVIYKVENGTFDVKRKQ